MRLRIFGQHTITIVISLFLVLGLWYLVDPINLGLYSDDWDNVFVMQFLPTGSLVTEYKSLDYFGLEGLYRYPQYILYPIIRHIGFHYIGLVFSLRLGLFILNLLGLLLLAKLLHKIADLPGDLALLIAFISLTFIGHSTTFFWVSTSINVFGFIAVLFMLLLCFDRLSWIKILVIYVSMALAVGSYESYFFSPLLIWFLFFIKKVSFKTTLVNFTSAFLGSFTAVVFKLEIYPHLRGVTVFKELSPSVTSVPNMLLVYVRLIQQALVTFLDPRLVLSLNFTSVINVIFLIIVLIICGFFLRKYYLLNTSMSAQKLILLGFSMLCVALSGLLPTFTLNTDFQILGVVNRVNLLVAVSIGLLLSGFVVSLSTNLMKYLILSVILFINLSALSTEKPQWVLSWKVQQQFISDLSSSRNNVSLHNQCPGAMLFVLLPEKYKTYTMPAPLLGDPWTLNIVSKVAFKDIRYSAKAITSPNQIPLQDTFNYKSRYYSDKYPRECFLLYFVSEKKLIKV